MRDLLLVVAAVAVTAGFALAWYPLGLIAAGMSLVGFWWLTEPEADDAAP